MRRELRKFLEEIVEPGGGDDENVEIEDPNSPENKAKRDKMDKGSYTSRTKVYDSGNRKNWVPGY